MQIQISCTLEKNILLAMAKQTFFFTVKTVGSKSLDQFQYKKITIIFAFSRKIRSCRGKILSKYLIFKRYPGEHILNKQFYCGILQLVGVILGF